MFFLKTKLRFSFRGLSLLVVVGGILFFLVSFSDKDPYKGIEDSCRKFVLSNISKIRSCLTKSDKILSASLNSEEKTKQLIKEYREARQYYKEIEFFIENYSAFDAKYYINGPLVPKFDKEYLLPVTAPQGFQVIEECLFNPAKTNFDTLQKQFTLLNSKFFYLENYYPTVIIQHSSLTESLRFQLIRIMCLTLNGYDCTVNKETLAECAYSIDGITTVLNFYKSKVSNKDKLKELLFLLKKCNDQLKKNPDSDSFDRLSFITKFIDPAYQSMFDFFSDLKIPPSGTSNGVNFASRSFFENSALNKEHFSIFKNDTANQALQADLGKTLFFDPVLSGNNKRACASCHLPSKAFTDGVDKSLAFDGKSNVGRNSPTLLNVAYQQFMFFDGRVSSLEGQAHRVFDNALEMNTSGDEIVSKLKQSAEYKMLFNKAFKGRVDTAITFYAVLKCIAEFDKTLDARNSRFDKYLNGDNSQLSENEINGYNLFSGKALCGSCHFFPLFNSTVPPQYLENEYEVIGTPAKADNKSLDDDAGREKISHVSIHNRAFKTPTVRNIAVTAPYMHNGVFVNLDQVLDFYNKGGGAGFKLKIENQTLPFDSLSLSKKELGDIKAFLLALTDTSHIPKAPTRLPVFADKKFANRRIGGEY